MNERQTAVEARLLKALEYASQDKNMFVIDELDQALAALRQVGTGYTRYQMICAYREGNDDAVRHEGGGGRWENEVDDGAEKYLETLLPQPTSPDFEAEWWSCGGFNSTKELAKHFFDLSKRASPPIPGVEIPTVDELYKAYWGTGEGLMTTREGCANIHADLVKRFAK